MKKAVVLLVLVFLAACVPEQQDAAPEPAAPKKTSAEPALAERPPLVIPVPYTRVWQSRCNEQILWGYDLQMRLVLLNSSAKTVVFSYDAQGSLASIDDGAKATKFYNDKEGKLLRIEQGQQHRVFTYSSKGKLLSVENGEKLGVLHDSKGRLSSVARDGGASTEFVYDEWNRTDEMRKGSITIGMHYDSEGRLARMDKEDDHLVLGYWREDLLSSLSGTMYGLKETVNYGPESITLLSNVQQNVFESEHPEDSAARMDAFNTFLFCTRMRKLPVLFDGQSWVLYHEYMKGNITDYLQRGFVCEYLP
jgi:hypothetical protein